MYKLAVLLSGTQVKAELQQVVADGASWRAELHYFGQTIRPSDTAHNHDPKLVAETDDDEISNSSARSSRPLTAPQCAVSRTSLEPGGPRRRRQRRPRSAVPAPRLLVGAYSSLCTDPIGARGAPQKGPDFFYRRNQGNTTMHRAIGQVALTTRPRGRPRALKPPRADPLMANSRLYTPEDTLEQVMARFDHAESIRKERQKEEKQLQLAQIQGR